MKPSVPITLIIVGALLAAAPFTYSFILQALDEHGGLDPTGRTACMVMGFVLVGVGIVLSFFSRSSGGTTSK